MAFADSSLTKTGPNPGAAPRFCLHALKSSLIAPCGGIFEGKRRGAADLIEKV